MRTLGIQFSARSLDAWLTTGRFNDEFEKRLAKFIGVEFLITVNSGSSANLVAFSALTSPKLGARALSGDDELALVAEFKDKQPEERSNECGRLPPR